MSLSKYQVFAKVAQLHSITKAAAELGYTQAGASHLIAALEGEVGFPLLIRSKTGNVLTPEGEAMLPFVHRVLEAERDLRGQRDQLLGLTAGVLSVGTFASVAIHWLPEILSQFRQRYPNVGVSVIGGTYSVMEDALAAGGIDCAFVALPTRKEFSVMPLWRDRLMAVLPLDHPMGNLESIQLQELAGESFIVPAEGLHYDVGKLFLAAGIEPDTSLTLNSDYAAVAAARQGLGYTILPELMTTGPIREGVRCVPLEGSNREIGLAAAKGRFQSPALQAFAAVVTEYVRQGGKDQEKAIVINS